MNNFFKVFKQDWFDLSTDEKVTYVVISATTDFNTGCSAISREKISEFSGIKCLDNISKHTKTLVNKSFINVTVNYHHRKIRNRYEILDKGRFEMISRDILKAGLSKGELALYVSLILLRYKNSNVVDLTNTYERCRISRNTYYKYLASLRDKGLLQYKDGVVTLLKYIEVVHRIKKDSQEFVDNVASYYAKSSATYQKVMKLQKKGWSGIKEPDSVIKSLECGVPLHSRNKRSYEPKHF